MQPFLSQLFLKFELCTGWQKITPEFEDPSWRTSAVSAGRHPRLDHAVAWSAIWDDICGVRACSFNGVSHGQPGHPLDVIQEKIQSDAWWRVGPVKLSMDVIVHAFRPCMIEFAKKYQFFGVQGGNSLKMNTICTCNCWLAWPPHYLLYYNSWIM